MILPNSELLSSLQSSIADGGQKNLDLMDSKLQSNSNQHFNTTLNEALAYERSTGHEKVSEIPSNSPDAAVSECSRMQSLSDQAPSENQFKGLTESSEIGDRSHVSDTPIERVNNMGGDDRLQVNKTLRDNSLCNTRRAGTVVRAIPISRSEVPAQVQLEPPNYQMVSGEKGLPASVVEHSQRSGQLELSSAKSEQNLTTVSDSHTSRSERFSQAASRPVESVSVTGQRSLVDAAMPHQQDESILLEKKLVAGERENRLVLQNDKPVGQNFSTHNTNLKTVPEPGTEKAIVSNVNTSASRRHLLVKQPESIDLPTAISDKNIKKLADFVVSPEARAEQPSNSKLSAVVADARPLLGSKTDALLGRDLKISEKSKSIARAVDVARNSQALKISVDKLMSEVSSDTERPKMMLNSSADERNSQVMKPVKDSGITEISKLASSPLVSSRTGLSDPQTATGKDGHAIKSKEVGISVANKLDSMPLEALDDAKQKGVTKAVVGTANQDAMQVKVKAAVAAKSRTMDALTGPRNEAVPLDVAKKNAHRTQRKTDDTVLRSHLNVRSESLPAISDSRQSYPSLPSSAGQVAKIDASILEERVMQEAKQSLEESFDEVKGKSTRHEARFEKPVQSGGFLENSQTLGGSSAKSTTATPNNTSTVLMQRMVDTIQELKQSQNAQRVSFELDLAQGEKLKVRLRLSGDQMKSIFTTDSNTMKHLIRENWDQLQRQVEAEGFDLAQPDFTDRNPQQANDTDGQTAANEFFQADSKSSGSLDHSKENSNEDTHSRNVAHADEHSEVVRYA
jgi:hypothetical protein